MRSQRSALTCEDCRIRLQQIATGLTLTTRLRADQQSVLGAVECLRGICCRDDSLEQGIGAVGKLHRHALQLVEGLRHFEHSKLHGHVRAQHLAAGDAEEEGVADCAGAAGHGDANGGVSHASIQHPTAALHQGLGPVGNA